MGEGNKPLEDFLARLNSLLAPYRGQVEYGNVREQVSHWHAGESEMTNVAVTYESPGGSTNQINVSFDHQRQIFRLLKEETGQEEDVANLQEVMDRLEQDVHAIPVKRMSRLIGDIERWVTEGATLGQILAKLNELLKMQDLKGGSITQAEFQEATRHVTQLMRKK